MNRLRLIILLMFGSFLVMAQQIDAVVGMGYYDYLTRPKSSTTDVITGILARALGRSFIILLINGILCF